MLASALSSVAAAAGRILALGSKLMIGPTFRIFDAATITTRSELGASALTFNLAKARRLPWPGMGCIDEGLI